MPTASLQCICFGSCGSSTVSKTALDLVRHHLLHHACQRGSQGKEPGLARAQERFLQSFLTSEFYCSAWEVARTGVDGAKIDVRVLQIPPKINAHNAVVAPARIRTSSAAESLLSGCDLRKQQRRSAREIVTLFIVRTDSQSLQPRHHNLENLCPVVYMRILSQLSPILL